MTPAWSLRSRLLAVSMLVVLGFVVLTGAVLDRAFRDSATTAQSERLEALLYLLMAAADVNAQGDLVMPAQLPEGRLSVPGSGLYAAVSYQSEHEQWQSNSTLGLHIPFDERLPPAMLREQDRSDSEGNAYRVVSRGVRWAVGPHPVVLTFSVAAPVSAREAEVHAYQHSLWSAFALMAVLLLAAQIVVLSWGLRPLRMLARRLAAIQSGRERRLEGRYPGELAPLVSNLNRLLERERVQLERYRSALGDLAHSLKTPLAVLRGASADADFNQVVGEQVERMDTIVQYQLQRAATAGASQSAPPLLLAPLATRLLATLAKVHAARELQLRSQLAEDLSARLDEGDAYELLGNLLDNACKWAKHQVVVGAEWRDGGLMLTVDDDGPGIADPERLLGRGQRGDEHTPGHGIGLAIVHDIALAYRGEIRIGRSEWGGARVQVWLGC